MVQVSFESDFNYSSKLESDFEIQTFRLKITENVTDQSDLIINTETVSDLSNFADALDVAITHEIGEISYSGALDGTINWLGDTYDLVYNPIMLTSDSATTRLVAFTMQNSVSGEQRRMLYREQFGINNAASPAFFEYENDGIEPLIPAMQSASNATSSTRFYWISGNGNDPEYFYNRFRINGSSNSDTEIADISGFVLFEGNRSHTIHSWADTSYTVVGGNGDKFGVIGVNHSGSTSTPFLVDSQSFTANTNEAAAAVRVENDLYVLADGKIYHYLGDQDANQAEAKLNHSGTPGTLAPIITNNAYSGFYFTRMLYDATSQDVYLVGGTTGTTGIVPATYTSQRLYKTDITLSTITDIGGFDVGYYTNKSVFNLPNSQLYMFPGARATTMLDASTGTLVDSRQRLQDVASLIDTDTQFMDGFKTARASQIGYMSFKQSPAGLQDYLNPVFTFVTVSPL